MTTTIGFGSPNKANSYSVHGSALGAKEVEATRSNLGWPYEPFHVPEDVKRYYSIPFLLWFIWTLLVTYELLVFTCYFFCSHWSRHVPEGAALEAGWNTKFAEYEKKYPEEAAELKSITTGELPAGWEKALPVSGHFHLSLSYFKLSSTAFGLGYPHIKFLALGCGFWIFASYSRRERLFHLYSCTFIFPDQSQFLSHPFILAQNWYSSTFETCESFLIQLFACFLNLRPTHLKVQRMPPETCPNKTWMLLPRFFLVSLVVVLILPHQTWPSWKCLVTSKRTPQRSVI